MDLEQMLADAVAKAMGAQKPTEPAAPQTPETPAVPEMVSKAEVMDLLSGFKNDVVELVTKALSADAAQRKSTVEKANGPTLEDDPIAYLTAKAEAGEEFTKRERMVAGAFTLKALKDGMKEGND